MEELTIRGIPTRTWKSAPATLRAVLELSALHGRQGLPRLRGRADHLRRALPHRRRPRPRPRRPVRDHQGRPGGHRHAQPARVGHRLLGLHLGGRGRRPPQRLVDGSRAGLRAERLGSRPGFRRRGAPAAGAPPPRRHPRPAGHARVLRGAGHRRGPAGRGGVHRRAARVGAGLPVIPLAERHRVARRRDATLPDVAIEPDDDATIFYTSGTTGRPKGAVGTHRNSASNLMNLFFVSTVGGMRRRGPAPRREQRDPERQPPVGAALPRHRLPRPAGDQHGGRAASW